MTHERHDGRAMRLDYYHKIARPRALTAAEARRILDEDPKSVLTIDTETTGLSCLDDDVIQLAVVQVKKSGCIFDGIVYYNDNFGSHKSSWPEAEAIHHISPEAVKDYAPLDEDDRTLRRLRHLLRDARVVVGYNVWFDLDMLIAAGVDVPTDIVTCDVMLEFAPIYGDYNEYFRTYKWQKLTTAAAYYGLDTSGAHDALDDVAMTIEVLRAMTNPKNLGRD